nr:unnamed protein product [Spirometra erinaceieuropaei]
MDDFKASKSDVAGILERAGQHLNHNPSSNPPQRRATLGTRELALYKVDITALSETRFSEQGQLKKVSAGSTFFRSGRPNSKRQNVRDDVAIQNDILGRHPCLSLGIDDRLINLRLPLRGD